MSPQHLLQAISEHARTAPYLHSKHGMLKLPFVGVALTSKFDGAQVMAIAGRALKANITTLAPLVLPFSEQAKFLLNLAARKVTVPRFMPWLCEFHFALARLLCICFSVICFNTGG